MQKNYKQKKVNDKKKINKKEIYVKQLINFINSKNMVTLKKVLCFFTMII